MILVNNLLNNLLRIPHFHWICPAAMAVTLGKISTFVNGNERRMQRGFVRDDQQVGGMCKKIAEVDSPVRLFFSVSPGVWKRLPGVPTFYGLFHLGATLSGNESVLAIVSGSSGFAGAHPGVSSQR